MFMSEKASQEIQRGLEEASAAPRIKRLIEVLKKAASDAEYEIKKLETGKLSKAHEDPEKAFLTKYLPDALRPAVTALKTISKSGVDIKVEQKDDDNGGSDPTELIQAIGQENYGEKKDFFKLAQLLKGLAIAFDKDDKAKSFLKRVGAALKGLAGSPKGESRWFNESTESDMVVVPRHMVMEMVDLVLEYTCDNDCVKKYKSNGGDFKGGKGDAFDNCVAAFSNCCSGVNDPEALCAYIGRRAGKI